MRKNESVFTVPLLYGARASCQGQKILVWSIDVSAAEGFTGLRAGSTHSSPCQTESTTDRGEQMKHDQLALNDSHI